MSTGRPHAARRLAGDRSTPGPGSWRGSTLPVRACVLSLSVSVLSLAVSSTELSRRLDGNSGGLQPQCDISGDGRREDDQKDDDDDDDDDGDTPVYTAAGYRLT